VVELKERLLLLIVLAFLMSVTSVRSIAPSVRAIGVANVVVVNVFWGNNPLSPTAARPGDVNAPLSVVLSNVGDDIARSVNATLYLGPPLQYAYEFNSTQYSGTSISKAAGDMQPGSSFTLTFTTSVDPLAKEGIYRYNLQIAYKSARELQAITTTTTIDVPIWRGELHVQSVLTVPTKVYPDSKQVQVKVWIANSGQAAANDVQLRMELKPPFSVASSGSDTYYIGNLPAGQVAEADFVVDIAENATYSNYFVTLDTVKDEKTTSIGEVPLYVFEKDKFEILSVTPMTLSVGDSGDVIRVELKNTGSVKAESVRVQLQVGNFFSGTLTDFLGTMLAGEVKIAFFTVDVDSKAQAGQYSFDLRFDWNQDNNALDDTLILPINIKAPTLTLGIAAFAVIAVIAGVGYTVVRRRRTKASQSPTQ
jgi:hypothetical protein